MYKNLLTAVISSDEALEQIWVESFDPDGVLLDPLAEITNDLSKGFDIIQNRYGYELNDPTQECFECLN